MSLAAIRERFQQAPIFGDLRNLLSQPKAAVSLKGLSGSSLSFVVAEAFSSLEAPFLLVLEDKEEAAYYLNDLEALLGQEHVLFFPGSYRRPYEIEETDNANVLLRAEVLSRINSRKKPALLVSYPEALFEKVVTRQQLKQNTLGLRVGDTLSLDFLNETLFEYHFKRVDFVTEPGEFSVRGGIVDVFSFSHDEPYRIEFFGDEVDSIRSFEVESQLSTGPLKKISIIPNLADKMLLETRVSFLEYLPENTVAWIKQPRLGQTRLQDLFKKAQETFDALEGEVARAEPAALFLDGQAFANGLSSFRRVALGASWEDRADAPALEWPVTPQPAFNKHFDLLRDRLVENHQKGMQNFLFCASEQQARRFHDIFDEIGKDVPYETLVHPLYQGFELEALGLCCYTDHEIFERYHRFHLRDGYAKKQAITLKELNKLEIGDYVTHIDHGIGKFGGLQKIQVEGKTQEAIKLIYGDRDILYVSIHSLHKIAKYNGKDGTVPKIYKLGSGAWNKIKQKTKSRVKKIAFDLIEVYAKRRMRKGYAYNPDSYLQHELEASFLYEDTPDQSTATEAVKADMESETPMDRLICGDVGFGKTEIAIRAAFKAVDNGKQVAVLVPTTILAFQHFRTFKERMADMPVTVDYLNRFRSAKDRRQLLDNLASGKLDIVIGTHQLVGKQVAFKDLGLLIIDEEQKFGVSVKDKLKSLKENIDVLTLTATPIPRTLQFSLMAARDLSVINTPPPNRYPIESRVIRFDENAIRDAIAYEIQRGGQVFFVHNRIENIREVAGMLQRLVPDAKIAVGHGQMDGKKLEQLMLNFMNGSFDVLVSTTIIESGLDVSNANTIFINNANNFGLSDLHQMRGRVGRSNKKAFCYFITPPYEVMTPEARKRIQALEQFTELGSGFNIAMKDLEIRGAGDLLGAEQSGFINEIGFETYQKILAEAVEELKENEFRELYQEERGKKRTYVRETQIDTDFELLFPDEYINNITERLTLYTELNACQDDDALHTFREHLKDRFGPLPPQAEALLESVQLKGLASKLGLEKLVMKNGKLVGYFVADQDSDFYQSPAFTSLIRKIQGGYSDGKLKEKQTRNGLRLLLTFEGVKSVRQALESLQALALSPATPEA
ncbi:transcription-repair coupling factor [Robiginitalea sp. M366]|uniref:transcription-repair coupling factor n=1 Tax=Robiginitalea aestuariiviva TaxID=3036903 RepID=UPI00240D5C74|nr:transcription-repair coupling factor [Robiginitalea aestuariiviva]MDG1571212.1 transcription-repair coupling factor [Robiginitalea aestuariiviva]